MKLLPLQDITEADLPFVCDPIHARFWLYNAFRDYVPMEGFGNHLKNCEQEAGTLAGDPYHWNGRLLGYERLLAYVERGSLVLAMEPSDLPLDPIDRAFTQKTDGRFEPDPDNIWEPDIQGRFQYHADRLHHERLEQERYTANYPREPEPEYLPATGPGYRKATLGPHEDANKSSVTNTFKTQDEAARTVSQQILPTSIAEDVEYGGMIYRNNDGTYGYTGPIKGEEGSVNPGGPKSVPMGTTPIAYWHTHGAYNPNYESEKFSNYYDEENKAWVGDIPYAKYYKIDAYVATPSGKLRHYSVKEDKETLIGNLSLTK